MENAAISTNAREGAIIPMNLKFVVFTSASLDNIDVQIKSSLSKKSLNQHPYQKSQGEEQEQTEINSNENKLQKLPESYFDVLPFHLRNDITTQQN